MFPRIRSFSRWLVSIGKPHRRRRSQHFLDALSRCVARSSGTYAWRPPLTSGDSATLWDRQLTQPRADDLVRNDPHAVAGVTRLVDMVVGAGLRLSPTPNARALGLDPSKKEDRVLLKELSASLKSEWSLFADDPRRFCDAQRRLSMNGLFRMMARTMARRGKSTSFLTWRRDANARYFTCLRLVDPDRLSNPMGQPDTAKLRGGIEFDEHGTPLAYHVRNGHPADWFNFAQSLEWERVVRVTKWGRPVFIHAFEPDREDQSRAITPFASLMTRLRMIGKFADTELASATVNALFAAFVTSNLPIAEATAAFTPAAVTYADKRMSMYEKVPPMLNGVRIPVLPVGDEIKINSSPRQTQAFGSFQTAFLQSVAAGLGISYEQLSMDWSKTNYSSARAALNEVWRHIQTLFAGFVEQAVTPIYYAQVEEAFDRGYIKCPPGAPSFWEAPAAYLDARWIGPGRGYVDPTKEAEAASLRMSNMTSTLEQEAANSGRDWLENLDQIATEEEELKARGLKRVIAGPGHLIVDPSDDPAGDRRPGETGSAESVMMQFPHIAARIFNTPLMIDAGKAAAIIAGLGGRMVDGGMLVDGVLPAQHIAFANGRPSMGRLGDPLGGQIEAAGAGEAMLPKVGATAIIPIEGTLVHKGKWLGAYSGDTSYEGIQAQVSRARRDRSVRAVVFEIDSYGGEVAGAFDTASMIAQLSAEKPTLAILTDFAYSAGYPLASATRQIVLPETGGVGSIGVIALHADFSAQLEKKGIKVTVVSAGAHKADGHPATPLSADALARAQSSVNATRELFAEAVGAYRGKRLTKAAALATEARTFRGAEAVDAGLADGVGRPSELIRALRCNQSLRPPPGKQGALLLPSR